MLKKILVRKNAYFDSVTLMSLGSKIKKMDGVSQAVVVMATEMNREILMNVGLGNQETEAAGPNDLVLAVEAESETFLSAAFAEIEEKLAGSQDKKKNRDNVYKTQEEALKDGVKANMAVISVPGRFAAREAKKALKNGMHVMLFSDNVTVEQERELKELAREKGLFVMGPDCGTAVINGTGLCFANKMRKGAIGIVGASGTGLQEVLVQIDRLGGGIAQALGTGGRDLKESIGGIMMMEGIKALDGEEQVKVLVLVSKPPEAAVEETIWNLLRQVKKPVVVCFLEGKKRENLPANICMASTLLEAAKKAVALEKGVEYTEGIRDRSREIQKESMDLKPEQRYVRGFFCGGTLCAEALIVLRERLTELRSNVSHHEEEILEDARDLKGNVLLDLGEDEFTNGRPHPMIEPSLRTEWIVDAAKDPAVGVILLDVEIGYGSHENPAQIAAEGIRQAKETAKAAGRNLKVVVYVCGTDKDRQNLEEQRAILAGEGAILADSNVEAAQLAAQLLGNQKGGKNR